MRRILITGGAGFIGSHLSEVLVAQGDHVVALDDLSSGSPTNIAHLRTNQRFRFVEGSIFDQQLLTKQVENCDLVYHLAASVGVFNILERPVWTLENNIAGTDAIMRVAAPVARKVVIASTSEVYGKTTADTFREDGDLVLGESTKPRWGYAASKLVDEFIALAYNREYETPVVVVRLFNTIGPRQTGRYGMVVPRFVEQALTAKPVTVFGTGKQSRCFADVRDVVEWLYRLGHDERAVGEVYNLGNPSEISIEDLARRVIGVTGSKSLIEFVPYEVAYARGFEDVARRVPSIDKITALTGYRPQYGLDEALGSIRDALLTRVSGLAAGARS